MDGVVVAAGAVSPKPVEFDVPVVLVVGVILNELATLLVDEFVAPNFKEFVPPKFDPNEKPVPELPGAVFVPEVKLLPNEKFIFDDCVIYIEDFCSCLAFLFKNSPFGFITML